MDIFLTNGFFIGIKMPGANTKIVVVILNRFIKVPDDKCYLSYTIIEKREFFSFIILNYNINKLILAYSFQHVR